MNYSLSHTATLVSSPTQQNFTFGSAPLSPDTSMLIAQHKSVTAAAFSNLVNQRVVQPFILSSPTMTKSTTSPTNNTSKQFVFVEDKRSTSLRQKKKNNVSTTTVGPASTTTMPHTTFFHHHHYLQSSSSSKTSNKKPKLVNNGLSKIEKKSNSKNGLQCTIVKEEIVRNGEEVYEVGLEDGFTWWSMM